MVRLALILAGAIGVLFLYLKQPQMPPRPEFSPATPISAPIAKPRVTAPQPSPPAVDKRRCDGRKRCPQMRSCEEARWFLQHCRGMEMDGDGDGIPCETQWCGH